MNTSWLAVDWGTSKLRVWAMAEDGTVLETAESDQGMSRLTPDAFGAALHALAGPMIGTAQGVPVIACGMVGARQGWVEAAYSTAPCPPLTATDFARVISEDNRYRVAIVPGISQASPADVMRGEETQIAGLIASRPGFEGIVCLPGTHTKWVRIAEGRVLEFQTFMTGEMFSLLSEASVLRHSVSPGWDEPVFRAAVTEAARHPDQVAASLFSLRAEGLVGNSIPTETYTRLSGLLIGLELAGAAAYRKDVVSIIGSSQLVTAYGIGLDAVGTAAEPLDGTEMTLAGLKQARAALLEPAT